MPERTPIPDHTPPPSQGLTAISGAMVLIALLVMVQVWLLSAALEAYLAGEPGTALPAAIVSGVLFAISLFLYVFIERVDARIHRRL